jgi:hypothetical protein
MSGLIALLKLIVDSGAVSPKAPTFRERFGKPKPKGRIATGDTPAFGELGLKKFF